MNLITKAMNVRFLIRLYYDRTPSRNIRTSPCESVLFHGAASGEPDSLVTQSQIAEIRSLARASGIIDEIGWGDGGEFIARFLGTSGAVIYREIPDRSDIVLHTLRMPSWRLKRKLCRILRSRNAHA